MDVMREEKTYIAFEIPHHRLLKGWELWGLVLFLHLVVLTAEVMFFSLPCDDSYANVGHFV